MYPCTECRRKQQAQDLAARFLTFLLLLFLRSWRTPSRCPYGCCSWGWSQQPPAMPPRGTQHKQNPELGLWNTKSQVSVSWPLHFGTGNHLELSFVPTRWLLWRRYGFDGSDGQFWDSTHFLTKSLVCCTVCNGRQILCMYDLWNKIEWLNEITCLTGQIHRLLVMLAFEDQRVIPWNNWT